MDTLADRLAFAIKNSGLTNTAIAKAIGVSQSHISRIAAGKATPSSRTITDLSQVCGVDAIWLQTGDGTPTRQQTKDEVLAEVFAKAKIGDEPRDRMIRAFARLPVEDYAAMEKILLHIIEQVAQAHKTPQDPPSAEKEETP